MGQTISPVGVAVDPAPLGTAVAAVLEAEGADPEVAAFVSRHLVEADLADHSSHGVYRLTEYHDAVKRGQTLPTGRPSITHDGGATLTVDGGRAYGHIAARFTADAALERAAEHGVCVATLRNGAHVGRLGDHVGYVAEHGMIAVMTANDSGQNQVVAPHGGADGRLGTNPIAFGAPRPQPPHLVVDMATSAISHGSARIRARWAGEDDPSADLLAPAAAHKGFALGLAVEVLAGILSGAGWSGPGSAPDHQGVCLIVINPDPFCGRDALAASVEQLAEWVKQSPPAGEVPVRIPGEPRRAPVDEVRIDPRTWSELQGVFAETGVTPPPHRPLED